MRKAVVVLSGGMDSATVLYQAVQDGFEPYCISFDYGQKHRKELEYARNLCLRTRSVAQHKIVDLTSITDLISNSSLTSDVAVPDGHYAEESMKITVVPNRNMIMYSIAIGYAVNIKAEAVYVGVHAGDHFIYPDCRPDFIMGLDSLAKIANQGFIDKLEIVAPFLFKSKAYIASVGNKLGVPYETTWSCYKGGEKHCGKCGTCIERKEAFKLAEVKDPTEYEA